MGNPLLVLNPTLTEAVQEVTKIEVGDLLVDRLSTNKDWRKRIGRVTAINNTNSHRPRYTLCMGDNSTKWDALGWRWIPIERRKVLINKRIQLHHEKLTMRYEELTDLDKVEAEAQKHFNIGV